MQRYDAVRDYRQTSTQIAPVSSASFSVAILSAALVEPAAGTTSLKRLSSTPVTGNHRMGVALNRREPALVIPAVFGSRNGGCNHCLPVSFPFNATRKVN